MKKIMKKIVSIAALIAASLPVAQAGVIAAWTFENNAIAVNNSPAPSTGSGTASSIGMATYPTPNIGVTTDDVLAGSTGDTGSNGNADLTQIWRVRAQAGAARGSEWLVEPAPIGTQGVMFAASTVGYSNITVSFDWYATTQGEAKLQLQYTTDGSTWHNVPLTLSGSDTGLAVMTNSTSANTVMGSYVSITGGAGQDWFTGLTATISDPTAANNPKFAIEMVNASTGADDISASGTALNNTSGNWRFDNVTISGQPATFTGFSPGNLVLSRSVYSGDPSTVVVGQALPPVCPASANTAAPGACAAQGHRQRSVCVHQQRQQRFQQQQSRWKLRNHLAHLSRSAHSVRHHSQQLRDPQQHDRHQLQLQIRAGTESVDGRKRDHLHGLRDRAQHGGRFELQHARGLRSDQSVRRQLFPGRRPGGRQWSDPGHAD